VRLAGNPQRPIIATLRADWYMAIHLTAIGHMNECPYQRVFNIRRSLIVARTAIERVQFGRNSKLTSTDTSHLSI